MNFTTQALKDEAIKAQQLVVDNATPAASKDAKDELVEIQNATVGK